MGPSRDKQKTGAVLVLGGGIAGVQAALDLADSGYYVYLVEKSPAIGGKMAQLDKTFPTNDCSMCTLSPRLVECGRHLNIEILTLSELEGITGAEGHFQARVIQNPRYIDVEKCIACGACAEKCPKQLRDEFNMGIGTRKAAYIPYAQAVPLKYVIDPAQCIWIRKPGRCGACQIHCPAGAIDFEQTKKETTLEVGAIILAPGFGFCDPTILDTYNYRNLPDVMTSMEFERILSASGPYQGHMVRPSDQREPKKIAWLQCAGSRDSHHGANPYCSTVCCTYAIKQALIAKEHSTHCLDAAIFYIDVRTQGKDFERYYSRAKDENGVRFVRSKITRVMLPDDKGSLVIQYTDGTGKRVEERFDLVVLSVGLTVQKDVIALAKKLGIELDHYNFAATSSFSPVHTSQPGIYVCGAFEGPKDIPESVMQASAAVCASSVLLAEARNTLVKEKAYPVEREVRAETPRIGVFVCHCGTNIGGVVDVPAVRDYAKTLPYVTYAEENLFTCSQDTQEKIKQAIREHHLNRIVVASCTPRTHEPMFRETLREAGLSKYVFEMANIRDQCSWVHVQEPARATEKAQGLVRMAVGRATLLAPLEEVKLDVTRAALVVGGGLAGMAAALGLADQGFPVHLVEKDEVLGGHAHKLVRTWKGEHIRAFVAETMQRVEGHPLISLHLASTVVEAEGFVGNFSSTIKTGEETKAIEHGAVIIATGAQQLRPSEYAFGKHPNILLSLDLDQAMAIDPTRFQDVQVAVFIQCVGSREPQRPYCSKVCCTHAIQSALKLMELNPGMDIYVLFRDIRTYGEREEIYRKARSKGIIFIRYSLEEKPKVEMREEKLRVTVVDQAIQVSVQIDADILALASAIVPYDNTPLSKLYKVSMNQEGFFLEAHMKLRPVDFATDGVFLAGLCHYPKPIEESIAQATAAAARASAILVKEAIEIEPIVSVVDPDKCNGCGICERVCPYGAMRLVEVHGVIKALSTPASCKGCGVCAASCPSKAVDMCHFSQQQIRAQICALA